MRPTTSPKIKICCLQSVAELDLAVRCGANAVGLVSRMPSGPGPIPDDRIAAIASRVPAGVASFLLTSERGAAAIADQVPRLQPTTVQIVDRPDDGCRAALRRLAPGVALVQVVHVRGPEAVDEAVAAAPECDAILLDSGNPALAVKELGGTGRTHDWVLSRRIREAVMGPVWLAGGLTPENVARAIGAVGPYGVDVCSGVRTEGKLDEGKLAAFVAAVTEASTRRLE